MEEFDALVGRVHAVGLKLLIDYIPNHVARDYQGPIVHFDYCDADWTDTLKNDWSSPATRAAMLDILRFWIARGVDGFRCDMVELVPPEALGELLAAVRLDAPQTLFVAEVYGKDNYRKYIEEVGFDLLYDKSGLYDSLRGICAGSLTARAITWNWQFLGDLQPRMLNFGQEVGENAAESGNGRTSIFDITHPASIGRLYQAVHGTWGLLPEESAVLSRYRQMLGYAAMPVFRSGKSWDLCYCNLDSPGFDADRYFAFLRYDDAEAWLVFCNFSDAAVRGLRVAMPPELAPVCGCSSWSLGEVGAFDAAIVRVR